MVHPQIAVFARLANGAAGATRALEGQGTLLGRTMHAISYDEVHDEIVVPQQFAQAILTFRGGANGEEAPIRVIQGSRTQLKDPDRVAVDPVHNELFVPTGDSVLVFPRDARGNVAPIRILRSDDVELEADAVAIDPIHDLLIVAGGRGVGNAQIAIFNRSDQGNVKPRAVISGPKTRLTSPRNVQVNPVQGWILVTQDGIQPLSFDSDEEASLASFVGVWSIHDNGDVEPRWTIGGPYGMLKKPRGIAIDQRNQTVLVSDKRLNAVLTYSVPELFTTDAAPTE